MPSSSFSARQYITFAIQKWWVFFLAIVIGGLLGVAISTLQPPQYEAQANLSSSIDYTLLPDLEDYEEDRIINEAGWLLFSDQVLLDVQTRAKMEGYPIAFEDFDERFSADRVDDLWALRVVSEDALEASTLANIWADVSYQHLTAAHAYALEASTIRAAIAALESCQQADAGSAFALCEIMDMATLQAELDEQTTAMEDALVLSQALNPASNYTINRYAVLPLAPSYQTRGAMAFLGMLLGLVAGLVVLWFAGKKE
jgi:hypothetical protein